MKCLTRISTYKLGDGELLIRGRVRIMEGTDGGSIFVGVVTNLADAAKIEIMLNGREITVYCIVGTVSILLTN